MRIRVKAFDQMRRYLGERVREVELSDNARFSDLLLYMEKYWYGEIPDYLWDEKKHCFRRAGIRC